MCMICDGNGNVVVQERNSDFWPGIAFPGGHVEKGESFTDAVVREVREETGLTVSGLHLCGVRNWTEKGKGRYVVLVYRADRYEGDLASSDEGKVYWAPIDKLADMPLAFRMESMLRLFLDDTVTESFIVEENGKWIEIIK